MSDALHILAERENDIVLFCEECFMNAVFNVETVCTDCKPAATTDIITALPSQWRNTASMMIEPQRSAVLMCANDLERLLQV